MNEHKRMVQYCITSGDGQFIQINKKVKKFVAQKFDEHYVDDKYGHDFIEEMVNLDIEIKYRCHRYKIFTLM
jgi:hypothetical protein